MRIGCRSVALATALAAVLAFGATAHAFTASKCSSGKAKTGGKFTAAILGCYSKASGKGIAVDANCTNKANAKLQAAFTKLDLKDAGGKPADLCPDGEGDGAAVQAQLLAHINDMADDLDPSAPGPFTTSSKCTSGKLKCAGKKEAAILGCYSKAMAKAIPIDGNCITKADTKLTDCYAKLEGKEVPPKVPPTNVCVQPDGDKPAIEGKVDAFSACFTDQLDGGAGCTPPVCPTQITFTGTSTTGVLDSGWTGFGHDASVVSKGTVTVTVTSCAGAAPNCGVCSYIGPVENAAGQVKVHRCAGDSSIQCANDAACGGNAPCKFFFGSYLPLVAGGVSTCVENTFVGSLTGTANVNNGQAAGLAQDTARVFTGITLSNPCPRCLGDATQNDGVQGGTCSGGTRNGLACDASGSSPNISLGTTSLDCPPVGGALIATLPINLDNTTGSKTRTLSAASPNCRAAGFTTNKCQCDTCNNLAATPCSSNADCGAGICGGKRCVGGTNAGAPCSATSECPGAGASCSVPGQATAPNACDPGATCVGDAGTPSPNDRICDLGPFDQLCSPTETFRGCTVDADCTFKQCVGGTNAGAPCTLASECAGGGACNATDTCTGGKLRDCFDNGLSGDVVTATGNPDPPSGHQSDPTLAALFCVGPTSAAAVNAAAGLPGLGRLELGGHSVDNGTP